MIKKPEQIYEKAWGQEIWWKNIPEYCSKTLKLQGGYYCSLHRHSLKLESFICQSGIISLALENNKGEIDFFELEAGDVVDIPIGKHHSFYGVLGWNEILEVSTQHFESDSYRLFKSGFFDTCEKWESLVKETWEYIKNNPYSGD